MLCDICRRGLEGMHDPTRTPRIGLKHSGAVTATQYKYLEIERYVYGHHPTTQSLIESADDNCLTCSLLRQNANPPYRSPDSRFDDSDFFSTFEVSFKGDMLKLLLKCGDLVSEKLLVPVGKEGYDDNVTFESDNNTDGPRARRMLEQWVGNCTSHHDRCRLGEARTFLPTRLLKIDNLGGRPTSRLVLRPECPQTSRYIVLSYVWGTGPISEKLRLLHSSFERLRKGMFIDELPRTFRDAVRVW
jgi:hypothetical protein